MRILHTSDWHIGRTFHGNATVEALRLVLGELPGIVRAQRVDVVVVAGDVFDSAAPAAGCYPLLTDTLIALREAGAHVIVTSGNHDSAARLGFQSRLLREGIHVLTDPEEIAQPVTVDDADGPVHFYGIPYLEPALIRHLWPGIRTQAEAIAEAMSRIRADGAQRSGRRVVLSHCFTSGVEPTAQLERDIQQGGLDVVPLDAFDGADYVALGHIHGRSTLADHIRYSGAPLHYSFGERDKPRGVWIVDLDGDGRIDATWVDLPIPRALRVIRGPLDELLSADRYAEAEDAWVSARYTDTSMQVDPMRRLSQRFPHCAEVRHEPAVRPDIDTRTFAARVAAAGPDDVDLVDAFLRHVRAGEGASEPERTLLREIVRTRAAVEASA